MTRSEDGNGKLKAQLAKGLKLEDDTHGFEILWAALEERGITEEWELGKTSEEDILEDARILLGYFRAWEGRSSPSKQRQALRPQVRDVSAALIEREMDMANALRLHFAAHAARQPLVQRFRSDDLPGGRLLTEDEEISTFLAEKLGVQPDLEKYLASRREKRSDVLPFKLAAEPPQASRQGAPYVMTNEDMAEIFGEEERRQEKLLIEDWVGAPTWWHLEELGEWLANKYPWENVRDAEIFLISGRPPRLPEPLSATMDMGNATYSITFSPWVSEEAVLRAYREIQQGHRAGQTTQRRPPGDKTRRVLRLVCEQTDAKGQLPSWEVLRKRWNAANPDERYATSSGLFKAYKSAIEALCPPYLPLY